MSEQIAYKIVVESDMADKSVGQLKQDFKDLTDQLNSTKIGTEEYKKTLQSLGVVKGGLQDLKQQIQALNPEKTFQSFAKIGSAVASGFAAAQAATALFGSESQDLMKVLVKVQAATALASGLQGLAGFGKALQVARLAMIAFAMSNPFTAIALAIGAVVAAIGFMVNAYRSANSEVGRMEVAIASLNKVYETQKFHLSEEIRLLEAQKGKQEEVVKKKRELIEVGVKEAYLSLFLAEAKRKEALETQNLGDILAGIFSPGLLSYRRIQRIKEADEQINENKKKLETLKNDLTISLFQENNIKSEKAKERAKEKEKENAAALAAERAHAKRMEDAGKEAADILIAQKTNLDNTVSNHRDKEWEKEIKRLNDEAELELAIEAKTAEFKNIIQSESFKTIGELAIAFQGKSEASQRRAFNINKAAGIAQTTVDTFVAVQKAFASQIIPGDPTSPIRGAIVAALVGAAGLARVAKIAKTQFGGGADTSGGSVSAPNTGGAGGSSAEPPQFKQADTTGVNKDSQGNFQSFEKTGPQKVYVLESDISSVQKKISVIEKNATY